MDFLHYLPEGMGLALLVFTMIYGWILLNFKKAWKRKQALPVVKAGRVDGTLLIPVRNEVKSLSFLLPHLKEVIPQDTEIIFINDHSEDRSYTILFEFIKRNELQSWKLINNKGIGKKAAISTGVDLAGTEIILSTDADCSLPPGWVDRHLSTYKNAGIQMAAGPVVSERSRGFFSSFQQIEWASILLVTNALFQRHRPIMCSAANMSYRKSAFQAVNGYGGNEKIASGDDEFLLKKIAKHFGAKSVFYLNNKETLVRTEPHGSFAALTDQRSRWAGKWHLHSSWGHWLFSFFGLGIAVFPLSSIVLPFGGIYGKIGFVLFWVTKITLEKYVLGSLLQGLGINRHWMDYALASVLHPIYVVVTVLKTFFGKSYWKGRDTSVNN